MAWNKSEAGMKAIAGKAVRDKRATELPKTYLSRPRSKQSTAYLAKRGGTTLAEANTSPWSNKKAAKRGKPAGEMKPAKQGKKKAAKKKVA